LSKLFARDGYRLVINARHERDLARVASAFEADFGVPVTIIPRDLSQPGAADEIVETLQRRSIRVDVLVNNAGFGLYGPFAETDLTTELAMMRVNMTALTHLTKLFLGPMLEQGAGEILNVASVASFQPGPMMAVYYASKAYVLSFSEALSSELSGTGVTVTALCPGPTATDFQRRAQLDPDRWLTLMKRMEAETVARAGYRALKRDQAVVVPGLMNQLIVLLGRFLPRTWLTTIVRRAQAANT
jgi:hypothetical protein